MKRRKEGGRPGDGRSGRGQRGGQGGKSGSGRGRGGGGRRGGGTGGPASGGESRFPEPPAGLFRDVLLDPDRDRIVGARPVVAVREDDEPAYLAEVERRTVDRARLLRRGRDHGTLVELDSSGLLPTGLRRRRREALSSERWCAARPILLPAAAREIRPAVPARRVRELHRDLSEPAGLARWLDARRGVLEPRYSPVTDGPPAELFDPERDLARVLVPERDGPADLWLKTARLSTFEEDRSLRLRVSFGREGDDDASSDPRRLAAAADLAARLVPGVREIHRLDFVAAELEKHLPGPFLYTQAIAYWNAPQGGALFHHDAFAEDAEAPQRGVVFVQFEGTTVWLALSIEDLARRVREFVGWMLEGEAPWLRAELFPDDPEGFERVASLATGPRGPLLSELALPGCGLLAPVVNRGPEFTCTLADAGHALFLHPGDVLFLPNHGLERTVMHSVFTGSTTLTYGLSLAIRDDV